MTTGMVLGKFLPPHAGHCYLIDFARSFVDQLTVVVGTLSSEPIPGRLRFEWMRELFESHGVRVVHLDQELPQDPSEHPEFWRLWEEALRPLVPSKLDHVFASEHYGWKLAEVLDATFIPVDIDRSIQPISGTEIRSDPLAHWQYLPNVVRRHYLRRVCVFGPESTGKSTLARQLAEHFQTAWVPEYARTLIESQHGQVSLEDMPKIARGQVASQEAIASLANRVLISDTDPLLTTIWSDWLFGQCSADVTELANRCDHDLYLLTDVDVPWVDDQVRYAPNDRRKFFEQCEATLQREHRHYVTVSGDWDQRWRIAVNAINQLMGTPASEGSRLGLR
ncbi:MAG: AAA family ATPase [Rubripirellula sp.]